MSLYWLTLLLLAIASLATAIPKGKPNSSSTATFTATPSPSHFALPHIARFDNDLNVIPIKDAEPVNVYDDILFNGFTGVEDSDEFGIGILPQSPPNSISYGPLLIGTVAQGPAAMTTVYQDTTVDYFDLESLYYGCVLSTETTAVVSLTSCSITATCVNTKGKQVAQQSFDFVANGALSQQMVEVVFDGFKGCQTVRFITTSGDGAYIETRFDTVSFNVYSPVSLSA